ncbi:hypothetical protein BGZ97_002901 [Linnemannia gamsii]|uniref:Uncharacterized protein n=1 Tax=Linnemannia gamsii TaxID=64522 RepID=A0A9P6QW08_9FUNG|nr:hypothetical protein BGZ97_002901 [Linnemannia gamsii]
MQAVRGLITKTATRTQLFRLGTTNTTARMALSLHHQQQTPTILANRAVVAQQQSRTFVSPSRIVFAADSADVEKGVQNITDLFMIARDELKSQLDALNAEELE